MSKPLKTTNKRIIKMLEKMRERQAQGKDKATPTNTKAKR